MLRQNLRYGARFMRHNPGFTAVIVVTLALGIGENTAIFSVVYSALLRPLPYRQPGELLFLGESRDEHPIIDGAATSYPDFLDWKRTAKSFQSIAAYGGDGFTVEAGGNEPKLSLATRITPNFFATLGVAPVMGRDFLEKEDDPNGPHVAILSDAFWRNEMHANPNVVGTSIRLDGKAVTVVGVTSRDF